MTTITMRITLACPGRKATGWVRLLEDGDLEFELYDREYQDSDWATMYRVAANQLPFLFTAMTQSTGDNVDTPGELLAAIERHYPNWDEAFSWLSTSGVKFTRTDDPWA